MYEEGGPIDLYREIIFTCYYLSPLIPIVLMYRGQLKRKDLPWSKAMIHFISSVLYSFLLEELKPSLFITNKFDYINILGTSINFGIITYLNPHNHLCSLTTTIIILSLYVAFVELKWSVLAEELYGLAGFFLIYFGPTATLCSDCDKRALLLINLPSFFLGSLHISYSIMEGIILDTFEDEVDALGSIITGVILSINVLVFFCVYFMKNTKEKRYEEKKKTIEKGIQLQDKEVGFMEEI